MCLVVTLKRFTDLESRHCIGYVKVSPTYIHTYTHTHENTCMSEYVLWVRPLLECLDSMSINIKIYRHRIKALQERLWKVSHTYIHAYLHTYVRTYVYKWICLVSTLQWFTDIESRHSRGCGGWAIHTYMHTYIHTYKSKHKNKSTCPASTAYCIRSVIQSGSPIWIPLVSLQRNVAKET